MPFTFKLSQRLARMRCTALVLTAAALAACEKPIQLTDPGSTAPQVVVSPRAVTLRTNQMVDLMAVALTATGDTASLSVTWSVTSGSVTDTSTNGGRHYGQYKAGSDTGKVKVIARGNPGGSTDTAVVTVTAVPVSAVTITPASASVLTGQTAQLAATTTDSAGNVLTERSVTWTSNNSGVASVSGSGLVSAGSAGSALITATSEGKSGTATVTVTSPAASPGTVTDLAVTGVTDTSATLSFTEVTDGTGQPASYDVRYAAGTISWGSATEVSRGTCATPVAGTAIGAKRTCTVLGLASSTAYSFQLVAFRGTLGVNAVFGGLSNVASGTTAVGAPAPVASVTVSPTSASIGVGGTQQFTATLKDASGNVLTGRTVSWTSSVLNVATVSAGGLVTALLAGTTTITATSGGQSGTAGLTVTALPPPPSGSWPNEPTGLTVLSDYSFTDPIPLTSADVAIPGGSGWMSIYNGNGNVSLVSDPTAPLSTASVLQMKYPTGFVAGSAPGTLYRTLPTPTQLYVGFWWKPSAPWQGEPSNVNKIAFWWAGSGEMPLVMYGPPGGPYELKFEPEFGNTTWLSPTVHVPVTLGVWHRVESFMDTQAGIVRWWLDGQLIGDQTFALPSGGFSMFQFSPTWGGGGSVKSETDYFWFDHVRISGR